MTEKKITKREMFARVIAKVQDDAEMVKFLEHEVELLDRKAKGKKGALSEETKALMEKVVTTMTEQPNRLFTCGELGKIYGLNPQKMFPVLKKMLEAGTVTMTKDKRLNVYQLSGRE